MTLTHRSDFKRNPAKAVWRRFYWRLRWKINLKPWILPLDGGLKIAVPKGGAGALIFYQGVSELETADFIQRFLDPGMTFLDIGAHIGEYALLAGIKVGHHGEVHAFEPHPGIFELLKRNILMNALQNVVLNPVAVSDRDGDVEFEIFKEPSVSSIRRRSAQINSVRVIKVPSIRLDTYWTNRIKKVDLIKVDVEGAEIFVLRGADSLLSRTSEHAPVIIFEYSPKNTKSFGYDSQNLLSLLYEYGYRIYDYWVDQAQSVLIPIDSSHIDRLCLPGLYSTGNLIAMKDLAWLVGQLKK